MADTIRERIMLAIKAELETITLPAGLTVERNKTTDVTDFPSLVIHDGTQETISQNTQFPIYRLRIPIDGHVQNRDETTIGARLSELHGAVVKVMTANVTHGNLAIDTLDEGADALVNVEEDENVTGEFQAIFAIDYATKYGDPYTLAP